MTLLAVGMAVAACAPDEVAEDAYVNWSVHGNDAGEQRLL